MQAGRTLQKLLRDKDSFVLTTPILEGTDGRKMSKSWGNAIWLDDTAYDMYAKVMAIDDSLLIPYFTLATNVHMAEIKLLEEKLSKGEEHPMKAKKQLAQQIVAELYDRHEAEQAAKAFENIVQKDELPSDIPIIVLPASKTAVSIADALANINLALSKSDAKRLVEQGGVRVGDTLIKDHQQSFKSLLKEEETLIQVGKRRFVKIKIETS